MADFLEQQGDSSAYELYLIIQKDRFRAGNEKMARTQKY